MERLTCPEYFFTTPINNCHSVRNYSKTKHNIYFTKFIVFRACIVPSLFKHFPMLKDKGSLIYIEQLNHF